MNLIDIFGDNAFSMVSLTKVVSDKAFKPSFIRNLGLFTAKGETTTSVAIESDGAGALKLVQTSLRGAPAVQHASGKRSLRRLTIPHLITGDTITADQLQGVRLLGSNEEIVKGAVGVVNGRLVEISDNIDLTEEYHLLGALQGKILDADGSELVDLYSEFGVTAETEIDFALSTATTNIKKVCAGVIRTMKANLGSDGSTMTGVGALCAADFFDDFVGHAKVEKAFEQQSFLRESQALRYVDFGGIRFFDYEGNGDVKVAAGKCKMFPMGANIYSLHYGPADTLEGVGAIGLPRYARQFIDYKGKFVELEVEANVLPLVTKPKALMAGKK